MVCAKLKHWKQLVGTDFTDQVPQVCEKHFFRKAYIDIDRTFRPWKYGQTSSWDLIITGRKGYS